jgi:hypothetical protein
MRGLQHSSARVVCWLTTYPVSSRHAGFRLHRRAGPDTHRIHQIELAEIGETPRCFSKITLCTQPAWDVETSNVRCTPILDKDRTGTEGDFPFSCSVLSVMKSTASFLSTEIVVP